MNDELEQQLDTLVRDACSVVPVPKSEYRRRLEAYGQKAAREALEKVQDYVVAHVFDTTVGRRIDDFITEALKELDVSDRN